MNVESLGGGRVRVTSSVNGTQITILAHARKPRAKSDAEIVVTWNPYSKQLNEAAKSSILEFLEEKLRNK